MTSNYYGFAIYSSSSNSISDYRYESFGNNANSKPGPSYESKPYNGTAIGPNGKTVTFNCTEHYMSNGYIMDI